MHSVSTPRRAVALFLVSAATALTSGVAAAQGSEIQPSRIGSLHFLGGTEDERARTLQLFGDAPTSSLLIRSASSSTPELIGSGLQWEALAPRATLLWNSNIPFSSNEGALWGGKGASASISLGIRSRWKGVFLTLAPELIHIENGDFQIPPSPHPDRSDFSSPWHYNDGGSADLPIRFGNRPITLATLGQSVLGVAVLGAEVGISSENNWWGPGIRNAIVMSDNAEGFPHLFFRTAAPWRTSIGELEGRLLSGVLTESLYFDRDEANDHRSLSGIAVAFRPSGEPNLALGAARTVYRPLPSEADVFARSLDAFMRWDEATVDAESDQLLSLFGRWVFPAENVEVYAEWSRLELPTSLRDFVTSPDHTQGFTVGLQAGREIGAGALRLQAELTTVEESPTFASRPAGTYYLGRSAPQGYTNRGQTIGAAIGPGASSQWLALDYLDDTWQAGLFGGRIRWENDAFYDIPGVRRFDHDVSVWGGIRATSRWARLRWRAEASVGHRFNYLFQRALDHPVRPREAVDVINGNVRIEVIPFAHQ